MAAKKGKKRALVRVRGYKRSFGEGERMFYMGRYGSKKSDRIPGLVMRRLIANAYNEVLSKEGTGLSVREIVMR